MRVSLNTIKQFTEVDGSVDELVKKINAQLGGVEAVIDLGKRYEKATIAKVVKCEKHPNADKLSVCEIDAGTGENIQVVCGAPNVREGIFVVWLPPNSTVPSTFDDKEPFILEPKELRGVISNGMLASAKELGIGDSHDGILEINPDEWKPSGVDIEPGASFAKTYGLDDTIIEIENKMFTHRPDLFGQIGVAREIAGIQHKQFVSPEWYKNSSDFKQADDLELDVFNDTLDGTPRFMAVAVKGIDVKPSPLWLQVELVRLGGKPINNIVDVTNYIMLLTAQPTHAYDYDKLRGHKLGARMARAGERATLLNGKTYELTTDDIVIADGEGVVSLGGIMGGGNSEVSNETKNIVLEVATFDMYKVRKSSMRHGIFTDALTRFNKGQSSLQNNYVMALLIQSVSDVSSGVQASTVFDKRAPVESDGRLDVTPGFINERLGLRLTADEIKELLTNVECSVEGEDSLSILPPFWRTDIEITEDIVEEVGRLYGFDKLPRELPKRSTKPAPKNVSRELSKVIRDSLSQAGANEVLTYSFVHENVIKKAGQDLSKAYQLSNALSPDLQYYRIGLTPSLIDKVHMNIKAGFDSFALFELNKVHYKGEMDENEPDVPNEDAHVALVVADDMKRESPESPYYLARKYLEQIIDLTKIELTLLADFDLTEDEWGRQLTAPYEPKRSAVIVKDGEIWGVVGEYRHSVKQAFKLPNYVAGFEVHQTLCTRTQSTYKPLSKYPSTERDVCFQVSSDTNYSKVETVVKEALESSDLETTVSPVDIYKSDDSDMKNITVRIRVTSNYKTLTSNEVSSLIDEVSTNVIDLTGATVV